MKDPKRLLEGDGTAFERELLGAIAAERPTRDLHRKMRLGIGLVGVGAIAKAASANWNQLALAGVVVVGLVTGGAMVAKRQATEPTPVAVAPAPVAVVPKATPVEPIPAPAPPVAKAAEPVRRTASEIRTVAPVADIREEIRLLDQARSAVRSGASARALSLLAKYEQRFPRGQFRQEVQVLRMEALSQSGKSNRAAVLAKKFLAEHPNSPHVERVEKVGD
jgi:TolA-binding protein